MELIASATAAELVPERRTVTGLVLPWSKPGHTSAGPVTVAEGAVNLPADLGRVKLLRDHSTQPNFSPVGYATAAEVTPEGLRMTFKVGATPDGDAALTDVAEGIRDALSVELIDTKVQNGTLTAATLTAVALVPVPAFSDARVEHMTAAQHNQTTTPTTPATPTLDNEVNTMPTNNSQLNTGSTNSETHAGSNVATPANHPAGGGGVVNLDAGLSTPPATPGRVGDGAVITGEWEFPAKLTSSATVPSGLQVNQRPDLSFSQAVTAIAALRTGDASADLTAALADITRSANPAISAPAWLGQMWDGAEYAREIIPTMTQATLTGLKAIGWRWVSKPEVGEYEGDKTAIPTGTVSTEPVEVTGKRLAAGHDIDRAYFDFNETEFLNSFFRARANDYAIKTDAIAGAFIVASAGTGTTVAAEPDLLHAAARARLVVKKQTRVEPSAYLVNTEDLFGLFQITQLDNPAYLDLLGVNPDKFIATDLVPAGAVVAYAKPAVTFYELAGSPIRVDAERIDHGGKDSGIFGYYATLLNNQRGIVSVPFGGGTGE